jgi:hypothetical protein
MVDNDDLLAPPFLEELLGALDRYPACSSAYGDFELFEDRAGPLRFFYDGDPIRPRARRLLGELESFFPAPRNGDLMDVRLWEASVKGLERSLLMRYLLPPGPGVLFRKELLERTTGYCEADALRAGLEDWEFWLRAAEADATVAYVPRVLYRYRQHGASLVSRLARAEHLVREFVYARHRRLFDRLNLRRPFLASGYRRSAKAAWKLKQRTEAIRLTLSALSLAPRDFIRAALVTEHYGGATAGARST